MRSIGFHVIKVLCPDYMVTRRWDEYLMTFEVVLTSSHVWIHSCHVCIHSSHVCIHSSFVAMYSSHIHKNLLHSLYIYDFFQLFKKFALVLRFVLIYLPCPLEFFLCLLRFVMVVLDLYHCLLHEESHSGMST